MDGEYRYQQYETVTLNKHTVIIDEQIKSTPTKEVYKVISDIERRTKHILKTIIGDDPEASHTIEFYMQDENNYFVEMIDYYRDEQKTFLLLKYYPDDNLYSYVREHTLSAQEKYNIIKNILDIGCHLHQHHYLHADIKPDNFFMDGASVRLGDLESMVKLNDLYNDTISSLLGTKGFKYATDESYTLSDELFAYIATIYYIEIGELLIEKEELEYFAQQFDPSLAIHEHALAQMEYIDDRAIQTLLTTTLQSIQADKPIECCHLRKHFETLLKEQEDGDRPNPPKRKWKRAIIPTLSIATILAIGVLLFHTPFATPACHKAYYIDEQTLKVVQKNGDIEYYHITTDDKFELIKDERVFTLANARTNEIECRDGHIQMRKAME